ncbi:hypothetical protein [Sphingobacterium paludis]|uniref:Uncharacterized protein n=1 Tax=Sphingobacterium paludis TaxID=1476465 RepID=A0A4R7DBJ5_9SPHI|nr:hypothetical protein [Sphingobacterium paludis]TDS17651.1 hypothetical protein B0I21_101522 [Sphingobacterium paludis]
MNLLGLSQFSQSAYGTILFGALSGGIGAELSGGNFWQGAIVGGVVAGLNHVMHSIKSPSNAFEQTENVGTNLQDLGDPPYMYDGKTYKTKADLYGAILVDQAAEQFGIKDIVSLAAALDYRGLLSKPFVMEGASSKTSFASKYGAKILPQNMPVRLPTHISKGTLRYTKVFGRFLGRMAGPIGWGILAYDVGMTLYNTQIIYNGIIDGK